MLHSVKQLNGFTVVAMDGEAGTVKDVYFDDEKWTIRYVVVETGGWFTGRKVLISPFSVRSADWDNRILQLGIDKKQIENSPDIDTDKPVSRQHEAEFAAYYGYPVYWGGPMIWGYTAYPTILADRADEYAGNDAANEHLKERQENADPHLRSSKEVIGYDIHATDDNVGHVDDFMVNDEDWSIQLMVVDTRNWWPGKQVMVSPQRIDRVSWEDRQIVVKLTRDEIENSAEYDPANLPAAGALSQVYRPEGKRLF